ncbi:UPF0302 protein [Enterococcus saigonensis]|uniref:UPF0302 protein n=1 Tax=Enterococcus saigonensis TaxID=1805431 RepID=A0A679IBM8_9ENTE|nr:ReoY family proteolytic degradation factor [Enterococcus saigonensis]BCA85509.1 UPF0302 protein [Enterococcus saigonensis]
MFIDVKEKKNFLNWFVTHASFSRREVCWILNYLANHEAILNNVHFVENADATNRGLQIRDLTAQGDPMRLFISGKVFEDSDQIFHEIRLNWKEALYIECLFDNAWENPGYLSILEDNPFMKWNENIDPTVIDSVNQFLLEEEQIARMNQLYQEIDQALETGDKERFMRLSEDVNKELQQHSRQKTAD